MVVQLLRCLLFFLALTLLTACDGSQSSQTELARKRRREKNEARNEAVIRKNEQIDIELLKKMIDNENQQCPKDVGGGILVNKVELKDTAMVVSCECENENLMRALDSDMKDDIKKSILCSICQNDDDLSRMKLLKKTNTSIVYLFINNDGTQTHEMVLQAHELPDSVPSEQTTKELTRKLFISNLNVDLPQQIDKAMTQQKAVLEGDNIILLIICNEDVVDMDAMKGSVRESKNNMMKAMRSDPESKTFLKTVKGIDCNIIYRYKGNKSGKTVDIKILKNELN